MVLPVTIITHILCRIVLLVAYLNFERRLIPWKRDRSFDVVLMLTHLTSDYYRMMLTCIVIWLIYYSH